MRALNVYIPANHSGRIASVSRVSVHRKMVTTIHKDTYRKTILFIPVTLVTTSTILE